MPSRQPGTASFAAVSGVPIGGSGFRTTPGTSWFTPIDTILRKHDLALFRG